MSNYQTYKLAWQALDRLLWMLRSDHVRADVVNLPDRGGLPQGHLQLRRLDDGRVVVELVRGIGGAR